MFKIELHNTDLLKSAFKSIGNFIDEINIKLTPELFMVKALTDSHAVFTELHLEYGMFTTYEVSEETTLNVLSEELMKVLNRIKPSDTLVLTADEGNFIIKLEGNDATRTFKLKLISEEYEAQEPPEIELPYSCKINTSYLRDAIRDSTIYSEKLAIKHDEGVNELIFSSEGVNTDLTSKYQVYSIDDAKADSTYALEYLENVIKADKFSDTVKLESGVTMPLKISYIFDYNDSFLSFLIAPRIDNEED